jgi:flavin-dependent dehydrogenase
LFHRERFRRDGITHLLNVIPELSDRARRVELTTPVLAASPLGLRLSRVVDSGLLLIGDAAGAPDPITGDGIALAMASVRPAANAIVSGDLASYERVRLAMGRNADRLGRLLLAVARAEGRVAQVLVRKRSLVTTLLDVALGRRDMSTGTLVRALGLRA